MLKLPRIVRLDRSDTEVYAVAAEAGEWAVVGSFHFFDADPATLEGKERQAFAHGFLGTETFGWGTLVAVQEISPIDRELVTQRLAQHLVERFGAPNVQAALPAAREEVEFSCELCEHEVNTLLSVRRELRGGEIHESFQVIQLPDGAGHEGLVMWGPESTGANG